MEHIPTWAIAVLTLSVPVALYKIAAALLTRGLTVIGTDRTEEILSGLLEAIADGVVTEDEVKALVDQARQKD